MMTRVERRVSRKLENVSTRQVNAHWCGTLGRGRFGRRDAGNDDEHERTTVTTPTSTRATTVRPSDKGVIPETRMRADSVTLAPRICTHYRRARVEGGPLEDSARAENNGASNPRLSPRGRAREETKKFLHEAKRGMQIRRVARSRAFA